MKLIRSSEIIGQDFHHVNQNQLNKYLKDLRGLDRLNEASNVSKVPHEVHKVSMVPQILPDVAEDPVDKANLPLADPDDGDDAEEINPELGILGEDQHSLIDFLANLLNDFKILSEGSVAIFAKLSKHDGEKLQTVFNQHVVGLCEYLHGVLDDIAEELLEFYLL